MSSFLPGHKYRITYQIPGVQRVPWITVVSILPSEGDYLSLNYRPEAGTSELKLDYILSFTEVDKNTQHELPRRTTPKERI